MSFKVNVTGVEELSGGRLATFASIDRKIYDHSRAVFIIEWDELRGYAAQTAASVAAKSLNAAVDVVWNSNTEQEQVPCFKGYVERAIGNRVGGQTYLRLECISYSKRTDLVPRYRAFQACTLLNICQTIQRTEQRIKIMRTNDLSFDVPLSLQYNETDFQYLSRMLHAWGIPMSIVPETGEVAVGARGASASSFPSIDESWSEVEFEGGTAFYEQPQSGGSGAPSTVLAKVGELNGQLNTKANNYFAFPDAQPMRTQFSKEHSKADPACYRLTLLNKVINFAPGQIVSFENSTHIVRSVTLQADQRSEDLAQRFELQQYSLPYVPNREMPRWPSRTVQAWVMDNEKDPDQQGRIQVKFDFEDLDPPSSTNRAWLHTLTPYGGGKQPSSDKASSYSGFYALPEVGERVLVEFLGEWDSEAVVIGCIRHKSVDPKFSAKESKRWRTPSGNEVVMTTSGSDDVVRVRCKDKIFFEAHMSGSTAEATITPGESSADVIHFKSGGGPSELQIRCGGSITMVASQALHLEGMSVEVKASGGSVNIDGSPQVLINTAPMPATPLVVVPFVEKPPQPASPPNKKPPVLPTPD